MIRRITILHAALRRSLPARRARRAVGQTILRIERRAKHQLIHLSDGAVLHVHFRMTGDWAIDRAGGPLPKYARAAIELDDDTRVVLVDPRALGTLQLADRDALSIPALGPEPLDPALDAMALGRALASRRGSIKAALLDQRLIAGVGNIYAAESLWRARIDPRHPAAALGSGRLARLLDAAREVIGTALDAPARYADTDDSTRFAVYDREGEPCDRCGRRIRRIVQAGRSTYYCPGCQR